MVIPAGTLGIAGADIGAAAGACVAWGCGAKSVSDIESPAIGAADTGSLATDISSGASLSIFSMSLIINNSL